MEIKQSESASVPYFSVVVPAYNREKFIAKTLQSILDQTFTNYEVIVVDDCSTDRTVEVVMTFLKDERFKLIQNPKNYERAKSRNIGMKKAKGQFLTLLDSDDLMYPDNLKDAYDFSINHPQYLFFRNYYGMVDEDGYMLRKLDRAVRGSNLRELAKGNFISCIGVFTHREIYKNIFFDEDPRIIVSEDWEYWLRVLAKYKLGTIKKLNSVFTEHPNRSISRFDPQELESRKMIIINKTLENAETKDVYGKYEKDMKVSAMIYVAVQANIAGYPKIALEYLKKALDISIWKSVQIRSMVVLKNALKSFI